MIIINILIWSSSSCLASTLKGTHPPTRPTHMFQHFASPPADWAARHCIAQYTLAQYILHKLLAQHILQVHCTCSNTSLHHQQIELPYIVLLWISLHCILLQMFQHFALPLADWTTLNNIYCTKYIANILHNIQHFASPLADWAALQNIFAQNTLHKLLAQNILHMFQHFASPTRDWTHLHWTVDNTALYIHILQRKSVCTCMHQFIFSKTLP